MEKYLKLQRLPRKMKYNFTHPKMFLVLELLAERAGAAHELRDHPGGPQPRGPRPQGHNPSQNGGRR